MPKRDICDIDRHVDACDAMQAGMTPFHCQFLSCPDRVKTPEKVRAF